MRHWGFAGIYSGAEWNVAETDSMSDDKSSPVFSPRQDVRDVLAQQSFPQRIKLESRRSGGSWGTGMVENRYRYRRERMGADKPEIVGISLAGVVSLTIVRSQSMRGLVRT